MKVKSIIETIKEILTDGMAVKFDSSDDSVLKGELYFNNGEFYKTGINVTRIKVNLSFDLVNIDSSGNDHEILIDKISGILLNKFYVDDKPLYISEIGIKTTVSGLSSSISIEYENEKSLIDSSEVIGKVNFNNKQEE